MIPAFQLLLWFTSSYLSWQGNIIYSKDVDSEWLPLEDNKYFYAKGVLLALTLDPGRLQDSFFAL